jgi:ribonuclease-3
MMDADQRVELEQILGYHFFEPQHLIRALTHPAYANEELQQKRHCLDQEAYSTLGDAVLKTGLILFLMEKGVRTKGQITQEKGQLEDNITLAQVGRRLRIKKFIRLGRGEKGLWKDGEEKILADTAEALIGAIFLDSDAGFGIVKQCIGVWFEHELKKIKKGSAVLPAPAPRVSPRPVSSRHGAPRGTRPVSRSRSRG